jgi:hypothetical protein
VARDEADQANLTRITANMTAYLATVSARVLVSVDVPLKGYAGPCMAYLAA